MGYKRIAETATFVVRFLMPHFIFLISILVVVLANTPVSARSSPFKPLLGSWTWNEKNLTPEARRRERVFTTLTFKADGTVEAYSVMLDGIGPGMGEALGDSGTYRLHNNRLVITSSGEPGDSWPTGNNGRRAQKYTCRIKFASDNASFHLSQCGISGVWLRNESQKL